MAVKKYFSPDFNRFFMEVAANNHKGWMDENRKRYEQNVREPFKAFLQDLVPMLHGRDHNLTTPPEKAAFRVNRDIRFSKDKTPYKTYMAAAVARGSRKDSAYAGLYLQLGPESVFVAGGAYSPGKQEVQLIRKAIAAHPQKFRKSIENPRFVEHFGPIEGHQNKVIPKEFRDAATSEPLLYNKSWFYSASLNPELVHSPNLMDTLMEYFEASAPVRGFLNEALI